MDDKQLSESNDGRPGTVRREPPLPPGLQCAFDRFDANVARSIWKFDAKVARDFDEWKTARRRVNRRLLVGMGIALIVVFFSFWGLAVLYSTVSLVIVD